MEFFFLNDLWGVFDCSWLSLWMYWMYENVVYIYRYVYWGRFSLCPTQECVILCGIVCEYVSICVYLCLIVSICVILCRFVWYSVSICVYLCVFCVYLCVFVWLCQYVRICASQIEVQFRVPNELFIKVCNPGCAEWGCVYLGVCVYVSICVYMCVYVSNCVYMCVYVCEYVRICV
jgi:hypothetical protein